MKTITINAMKRNSKLGFFTYREPGMLRMGVEELAEQALEIFYEVDEVRHQ